MRVTVELTGDERRALEACVERELERMKQGPSGWLFHQEYLASSLRKLRQMDTILSDKARSERESDI